MLQEWHKAIVSATIEKGAISKQRIATARPFVLRAEARHEATVQLLLEEGCRH